jgi:hypothetical protein
VNVVKRRGYLIPIPPDPYLEKMNKNSMVYRNRQRKLACILCANTATQILVHELEGYQIRKILRLLCFKARQHTKSIIKSDLLLTIMFYHSPSSRSRNYLLCFSKCSLSSSSSSKSAIAGGLEVDTQL